MTPAADAVLDGTYVPPPVVNEMTQKFLTYLKQLDLDNVIPVLNHLFTTDDSIDSWKRTRSTTSSSPFSPLFTDFISGLLWATRLLHMEPLKLPYREFYRAMELWARYLVGH
jgi:hypothetical protein